MKTNTKKSHALALACILFLAAGSAFAGTAVGNLNVSATVNANCTINSTTSLVLGVYDPISANASTPLSQSTTIGVACTNGWPTVVTMDQGQHAAGGSTAGAPLRRMISGASFLGYNLYTDNTYTTVWDGVTGSPYTGTGAADTITVYGQIPAAQNVPAGSYADTVIVTISF